MTEKRNRIEQSLMNQGKSDKEKSAYLLGVEAALERAFLSAKELARQTDTFLVVQRDGKMVKVKVD